MKVAQTKPATTAAKTSTPFFNKETAQDFFNPGVKKNDAFFKPRNSAPIQAKLNVGKPGDHYEKEADAMADKVVQRLSEPAGIQKKPIAPVSSITPLIQNKCASCEKEEKLQKKDKEEDKDLSKNKLQKKPIFESNAVPPPPPPNENTEDKNSLKTSVQKKSIFESNDINAEKNTAQRRALPVNSYSNTSLQKKSNFDSIVSQPGRSVHIQPKPAGSEKEERLQKKEKEDEKDLVKDKLQKKPIFESNAAPPDDEKNVQKKNDTGHESTAPSKIESSLHSSKGSGSPLPQNTRQQMESSFGSDFSNVRIHSNSSAEQMSKDLNAQAFTHGSDIYFNSGKYDTNSTEGKHLLAHELTHTVQQGNTKTAQTKTQEVSPEIQKAPDNATPAAPAPAATGATSNTGPATGIPEGYIAAKGTGYVMFLTKFPVKEYDEKSSKIGPNLAETVQLPKPGTRNTKQGQVWRSKISTIVKDAFIKNIIQPNKLENEKDPLSLKLVNGAKKDKSEMIGSADGIAKEIVVPFWNKAGIPTIHQIEHKLDWQILGNDADKEDKNLILLDEETNRKLGNEVLVLKIARIQKIMNHYKSQQGAAKISAPIVDSTVDAVLANEIIFYESLEATIKPDAKSIFYPKDLEKGPDENPINKKNIEVGVATIPPGKFVFRTSKKGVGFLVDYGLKNKFVEKIEKVDDNNLTISVKKFVDDPAGKLDGAKPLDLKLTKEGTDRWLLGKDDKGYSAALKNLFKLKSFSPIVLNEEDTDFNPLTGLSATGKVISDIPFLKDADIDFSVEDSNFTITASVTSDKLKDKLPKPLNIQYSTVFISASTKDKISVGGEVGFSIEKIGKGSVSAQYGAKGFSLSGDFIFDKSEKFESAEVKFKYAEEKWSASGELVAKENAIKGIKKGNVKISYGDNKLTGSGSAILTIPGIDKITLDAVFEDSGSFSITGKADFKNIPGIKSGNASITVSKKADDYELSFSGTAVPNLPKIPGLSAAFTVSYDKGLFKAEGVADYNKGKLAGKVTVGVTNGTIDEKGNVVPGEGGTEIKVYGSGQLTITIIEGLTSTLEVFIDDKSEVFISGNIKIHSSPFKPINNEKPIFDFNENIPIVGIPLANIFVKIGAKASVYLNWLPLIIDFETTLNKTSLTDIEHGKLGGTSTLKLHSQAEAGAKLTITVGAGVEIAIADVSLNINGSAGVGIKGDLGAETAAIWDIEKGLQLKSLVFKISITPQAFFEITGTLAVEINLWIHKIKVYEKILGSMKKELDVSSFGFNAELPVTFDDKGNISDVKFDNLIPNFNLESGKKIMNKIISNDDSDKANSEEKERQKIRETISKDLKEHKKDPSFDVNDYASKLKESIRKTANSDFEGFIDQTVKEELSKVQNDQT